MITISQELSIFKDAKEILDELQVTEIKKGITILDLKQRKFVEKNNINCLVFDSYFDHSVDQTLRESEELFYFETLSRPRTKSAQFIRVRKLLMYPVGLIDEPFQNVFNGDFEQDRDKSEYYNLAPADDPDFKFYNYLIKKDKIKQDDLLVLSIMHTDTYGYFKFRKLMKKIDYEEVKDIFLTDAGINFSAKNNILLRKIYNYCKKRDGK